MSENDVEQNRWTYKDWDGMAKALGTKPLLFKRIRLIRGKGKSAGHNPVLGTLTDIPVAPPPSVTLPNRHLEYVLTWWGIAAASLALGFLKR